MTPTQARAFLAVAIEGSFTGAAKRLNLSQPSVTTQVGLLERQYKVELFHRIGRGVRLTPAGNALLPTVRRLFTSLDEATAYLEDLRGQRQGYLRVGSYTPHRFIVLVARYKKRFPGASIWVEFANSQALAKKVLNYELDVAVTAREDALHSFHSLAFTSDTLIVLAPYRQSRCSRLLNRQRYWQVLLEGTALYECSIFEDIRWKLLPKLYDDDYIDFYELLDSAPTFFRRLIIRHSCTRTASSTGKRDFFVNLICLQLY